MIYASFLVIFFAKNAFFFHYFFNKKRVTLTRYPHQQKTEKGRITRRVILLQLLAFFNMVFEPLLGCIETFFAFAQGWRYRLPVEAVSGAFLNIELTLHIAHYPYHFTPPIHLFGHS